MMPFDPFVHGDPHVAANAQVQRAKVFGIGWAKTGTTTLGRCFELLGYAHQSQNLSLLPQVLRGDFQKTLRIASAKESFEDWPWPLVYHEVNVAFPGSLFVLTTRNPKHWLASYRAMLGSENSPPDEVTAVRILLYGEDPRKAHDDMLMERFSRHNAAVLDYFRESPSKLLVVDWEKGDGWEQICGFLGLSIPDTPFPHLNQRADWAPRGMPG